jgi:hypothetical protein
MVFAGSSGTIVYVYYGFKGSYILQSIGLLFRGQVLHDKLGFSSGDAHLDDLLYKHLIYG